MKLDIEIAWGKDQLPRLALNLYWYSYKSYRIVLGSHSWYGVNWSITSRKWEHHHVRLEDMQ